MDPPQPWFQVGVNLSITVDWTKAELEHPPWREVQIFWSILPDEHIQLQLNGAIQNEQVYLEVLDELPAHN